MAEFFRETLFALFNEGAMSVTGGDFVRLPVTRVSLRRNDELDLIFEFTSRGVKRDRTPHFRAGTVRSADETIEFKHPLGTGVARGVVARGHRYSSEREGEGETVETYSAHSVEFQHLRAEPVAYIVEWVTNLPDGFIWPTPVDLSIVEKFTRTIGSGDGQLRMEQSVETGGGDKGICMKVAGADVYLMHRHPAVPTDKTAGQIVFRGDVDQRFRDKVRTCLSFAFGKPLVLLGHTAYAANWAPSFMKSVDAFTIGGAALKLDDLPPYPINEARYLNVLDERRFERVINALVDHFDALKFNELSWSYWYAMCAPLHSAAVNFGSLIEQLQRNSGRGAELGRLLGKHDWKKLKSSLETCLGASSVPAEVAPILKGKIGSFNQAPPGLLLKRMFSELGLEITDAEMNAWRHRNIAAHGGILDDPTDVILNSKILRILFHRMIEMITNCSDAYFDYYNFDFPVRPLRQGMPARA